VPGARRDLCHLAPAKGNLAKSRETPGQHASVSVTSSQIRNASGSKEIGAACTETICRTPRVRWLCCCARQGDRATEKDGSLEGMVEAARGNGAGGQEGDWEKRGSYQKSPMRRDRAGGQASPGPVAAQLLPGRASKWSVCGTGIVSEQILPRRL
jgi:hypothetical protein